MLPTIVDLFARDTGSDVVALESLLAAGEAEPLARHAHKIKGACQAVGARRIAMLCLDLERACGEGRLVDAEPLVEDIALALPATVDVLMLELAAA
jgi:HPt (histidine-containing phosphotransfer) domain-containing protein